jgi:hypothetical protein
MRTVPVARPFAVTGLRLISVPARSAVGPPPQWSAELGPRSAAIRPRRVLDDYHRVRGEDRRSAHTAPDASA